MEITIIHFVALKLQRDYNKDTFCSLTVDGKSCSEKTNHDDEVSSLLYKSWTARRPNVLRFARRLYLKV